MRFLVGWTFDIYINLRYAIREAAKDLGYWIDDALDAWGEDE